MPYDMPLFEKLIDEDVDIPFEKSPKKFFSFKELQHSIREDLSRLLNSRVSPCWRSYCNDNIVTPFSYGINLTGSTFVESVFEVQELETNINNVVKQFEPRLMDAKSRFVNGSADPATAFVMIDASMLVEGRVVQLSFPVTLDI
jgi:type VI secretion system lysozyme-like protein